MSSPLTPDALCRLLDERGIRYARTEHVAVFTVAESAALRGTLPGLHTKNLFLKDKKGRYFLVSAREDARIDLKRLHGVIGASGRLSFGSAEQLMDLLGVAPGSVTALAVVNDPERRVSFVLDRRLATGEAVNFHPLVNTATLTLPFPDLLAFLESTGHPPLIVDLPVEGDGQGE